MSINRLLQLLVATTYRKAAAFCRLRVPHKRYRAHLSKSKSVLAMVLLAHPHLNGQVAVVGRWLDNIHINLISITRAAKRTSVLVLSPQLKRRSHCILALKNRVNKESLCAKESSLLALVSVAAVKSINADLLQWNLRLVLYQINFARSKSSTDRSLASARRLINKYMMVARILFRLDLMESSSSKRLLLLGDEKDLKKCPAEHQEMALRDVSRSITHILVLKSGRALPASTLSFTLAGGAKLRRSTRLTIAATTNKTSQSASSLPKPSKARCIDRWKSIAKITLIVASVKFASSQVK